MTIYLVELTEDADSQSFSLDIIAMPDTFRTSLDTGLGRAKEVKTFTLNEAFREAHRKLDELERGILRC